ASGGAACAAVSTGGTLRPHLCVRNVAGTGKPAAVAARARAHGPAMAGRTSPFLRPARSMRPPGSTAAIALAVDAVLLQQAAERAAVGLRQAGCGAHVAAGVRHHAAQVAPFE